MSAFEYAVSITDECMWEGSTGGMIFTRENWSTGGETCP
jgi:hypothetical protein